MKKKLIDELTVLMASKWASRQGTGGVSTKAEAIEMAEGILAFRHSLEADETLKSMEMLMMKVGVHDEFTAFKEQYYAAKRTKAQAETEETS